MYCETPIDLGNILTGAKLKPYLVGYNYDWTYRLCDIKANSDYSEFYLMCPLRGPTPIGNSLKEAIEFIEQEHINEGCRDIDDNYGDDDFNADSDIPF